MFDRKIGTIVLTGKNSVNFVNSIFHPTLEEIESHNKIMKRINENINIIDNSQGFSAEIKDLDLSFLESKNESITVHVKIDLIHMKGDIYNKSETSLLNCIKFNTKTISKYKNDAYSDIDMFFAA